MKTILLNAAVAFIYFVAAKLGLQLALVNEQVTPLWPPTGIALVAMLTFGKRMWPGVATGAFATNLAISAPLIGGGITLFGNTYAPLTAGLITIGNTLAPLAATIVLRKLHFRETLDRMRDTLALIFPAALGCMMISATFGATVLHIAGLADGFWSTWGVWWTGDAMGVLVVAPILLLLLHRIPMWPLSIRTLLRALELAAVLIVTAAVTVAGTWHSMSLTFMVAPCLIWAAFRFGIFGAAPAALLVSVISIHAASSSASGPFAGHELLAQMIMLQTFIGSAAIISLVLSALIEQHDCLLLQAARTNRDLAALVEHLTHGRMTEEKMDELIEEIANEQIVDDEKASEKEPDGA